MSNTGSVFYYIGSRSWRSVATVDTWWRKQFKPPSSSVKEKKRFNLKRIITIKKIIIQKSEKKVRLHCHIEDGHYFVLLQPAQQWQWQWQMAKYKKEEFECWGDFTSRKYANKDKLDLAILRLTIFLEKKKSLFFLSVENQFRSVQKKEKGIVISQCLLCVESINFKGLSRSL